MTADRTHAVVKLVAGALEVAEAELNSDSSMENTPVWDSFGQVSICLAFEREFSVILDVDAITTATSVKALVALLP